MGDVTFLYDDIKLYIKNTMATLNLKINVAFDPLQLDDLIFVFLVHRLWYVK